MAFSVSSWFVDQLAARASAPTRKFTVGTSDYSDRVLRWPRLRRRWNMIRPTNLTIAMANEDQALNFFVNTPTELRKTCKVEFGFTHPSSGAELVNVYEGTVERAQYVRGECRLHLLDKMKSFVERTVGTSDDPAVFSDSALLPSDIAWTLCTCYGGLSSIQSDSNPDIEWSSFEAWADVWSNSSVHMHAQFEGIKVTEALSRLSKMTDSAIYAEHGQIEFKQFSTIDSNGTVLTDDELMMVDMIVDDSIIVNRQHVFADYSVESNSWGIDAIDEVTASVNSYGIREDILKDNAIWYVNSASALNIAQRRTADLNNPPQRFKVETVLTPMVRSLGETIRIEDSFLAVDSGQGWRYMGMDFDMNSGRMMLEVDNTQLLEPFTLDDARLGLLDQGYNPLL